MTLTQRKLSNLQYKPIHTGLLIIVCVVLAAAPCKADAILKDSTQIFLKGLLQRQPDSVRIQSLIHLGNYLVSKSGAGAQQLDSALLFFDQGIMLANQIRSARLAGRCRQAVLTNKFLISKDTSGAGEGYTALINSFRKAKDWQSETNCWKDYAMIVGEVAKDFYRAELCYENAKQLYKKHGSSYGIAIVQKEIGLIRVKEGRFSEASDELSQAYHFFKNSGRRIQQVSCEIELASIFWKLGDTHQSLYFNSEALKTALIIKDDYWISVATNSSGRAYFNLKMYKEALPYFESSLAAASQTGSQSDYAIALLTVIYGRVMLKKTDNLLEYLDQADRRRPSIKDIDRIQIDCAYGLVYKATGHSIEAERSFLKMMRTFDELKKQNAFGNCGHLFLQTFNKTIGEFYVDVHEYEKARPYFEQVLALQKSLISPASQSDVHLSMYRIDSAAGRFISGIRHLQRHNSIHDSLFNASSTSQIAALKARYLSEQRSKDLSILKEQQRSQTAVLKTAKLQRNITLGGISALLILACVSYWAYRKKQFVNKQLESQKALIDDRNISLRNLLGEKDLLLAEKEILLTEKDWLLTEVHHRVKNNLQVITSLLNFQSSSTKKKDVLDAIKVSRNRVHAISLIHLMLSNDSNLASLNMQPYVTELIQYLNEIFQQTAKQINFKTFIEPINIDLKQAVPIGLILNEAITNCIKYAFDTSGGEISVSLKLVDDQMIAIEIADNGKGFPSNFDPMKTKSLGFKIMRGLTSQLKGHMEIVSEVGTIVTVNFPWRKEKVVKNMNLERVSAK